MAGLVGGAAEPVAHRRAGPGPRPGRRPPGAVGGGGVGQELPDRPDRGTVQIILTATQTVQLTCDLDRWSDHGAAGPDHHDLVAVGVKRPAAAAAAGRAGRGAQRNVAGVVGRPRGGDQDVGDRGWLVAVMAKPVRLVVDHHGEPPGSSWPLSAVSARGSAGWGRPWAMREGSWTWLMARCWWPSWIQRALQLVQMASGYRPKVRVTRADRHNGQRGMTTSLTSLIVSLLRLAGVTDERRALGWSRC